MAVQFHDVAERILAIDHAIRLFAGIIMANLLHPLPSAILLDQPDPAFEVGILNAEMKELRPPVFEGHRLGLGLRKLEEFDADAITGRQMGYSKRSPPFSEHIVAHLSDCAGVMLDGGRRHDLIKAERLGVELHRLFQVGNGDADMAEAHGSRHDTSSLFIYLCGQTSPRVPTATYRCRPQ